MIEQQNIEYKSCWRDEYLKWICGFANAQGGNIFIGIDDKGSVIGLDDYKKLMDDIPNKTDKSCDIYKRKWTNHKCQHTGAQRLWCLLLS
jgi:predicted HTH transcriptional regulator